MKNRKFCVALRLLLSALLSVPLWASALSSGNPLDYEERWSYGIDPDGSEAIIVGDNLITDGVAAIDFVRVPRPAPDRNSWIELIYRPGGNLEGLTSIELSYQCDQPLLIKMSQKDFGEDGDGSYAHYQTLLPATGGQWQTHRVTLDDFSRPDWTPATSEDRGLILQNVDALYFAPSLTDEEGGKAKLRIRQLGLYQ